MGFKVGELAITVACGHSNYWHAHLTTADTARLAHLLKDRSGMTWEALAIELGYGDLSGKDLIHCSRGSKSLGPDSTINLAKAGAKRGWLTTEEAGSFIDAITCARAQIDANKADMALTRRVVSVMVQALTKDLGLPEETAERLAQQNARQVLLDAKMALCDEQMWFDRLAYQDPDEYAATILAPRSPSSPRLPGL